MMRSGGSTVPEQTTIAEFRRRFPLGSVSRVVLTDQTDRYAGIVVTASAHAAELDPQAPIGGLVVARDVALSPDDDVRQVMRTFDESETDDLAVVDADGQVIGTLSERFVRRRYTDEIEKAQREMFGE
jgi:CIC family chloride channel protein